MRIAPVIFISLSFLALCCCGPKEPEKEKEAAFLVVDRQIDSHELTVSPEGVESSFSVSCDAAWEMTLPEDVPWLTVGEKTSSGKKDLWSVPYCVTPNDTQFPRTAAVKFVSPFTISRANPENRKSRNSTSAKGSF